MYTSTNLIAFVAKLMFTFASTFTRTSLICFYYCMNTFDRDRSI